MAIDAARSYSVKVARPASAPETAGGFVSRRADPGSLPWDTTVMTDGVPPVEEGLVCHKKDTEEWIMTHAPSFA
jgi:hypothetical protein